MYCPYCGSHISDLASVCVHCGNKVEKKRNESASALWWFLGFFFPVIGCLLWVIWQSDEPAKAKKAGVGALWGIGISVGLSLLLFLLYIAILAFWIMLY